MKHTPGFSKQMAASAAAPPVSPHPSRAGDLFDTAPAGAMLRVAIMGLGDYATRVAEAMQSCKRAKLAGLISGTPSKLQSWRTKYQIPEKNCYNYENFDRIRDNADIDVVYVITPNGLHHDEVIRVARTGKHVISEKPISVNATLGQEMVDACEKAGVKFLVGYRMHFEPNTLEVIQMRKDGEFGKIMFFQAQCGFLIGDPTQWRLNKALSGGGSLMDIGIYAINGSRYMTGEDPIWVTAQETKTDSVKFKEGVDETIQFDMGFPSGVIASCLSTYNMDYLDRFYLVGQKGYAEMQPSAGYGPIKGHTMKGPLTAPIVTHQTAQMDAMAGIILNGEKSIIPVDGKEAIKDLKIIDAIYKACQSGKRETLHL